jgi:uncharacterized protein with von Willebrand factor type A (vWA) domain
MKRKRNPLLWIVLIIVVIIVMCVNKNNNKTTNSDAPVAEQIQQLPDIEVSFDESAGEASLAKNIYILFDGSGSMDELCSDQHKIDGAKQAIIQYIKKIPGDYNLGLLVFGTYYEPGYEEYVPLGSENHQKIIDALQEVKPDRGTPLATATAFGVEKLTEQYKKQLGYGEYRLVIVTDGLANEPDKFQEALLEASRYSFIAIYSIGLCMEEFNTLKQFSLSYTDAKDYVELGKALEKTIGELQDFDPTEFVFDEP